MLTLANVIASAAFLLWGLMRLGVLGVVFTLIGFFAPTGVGGRGG